MLVAVLVRLFQAQASKKILILSLFRHCPKNKLWFFLVKKFPIDFYAQAGGDDTTKKIEKILLP